MHNVTSAILRTHSWQTAWLYDSNFYSSDYLFRFSNTSVSCHLV